MARPAARSRRRRDEDEEDDDSGRRGRGAGREKPKGPPAALLLAGAGGVLAAVGIGIFIANSGKKAPIQLPPPVVVAKPRMEAPPPPPKPTKVPPKPLTPEERAYIEGLFARAKPHFETFQKLAREGWDLKKKEDNEGANARWVKAKHEYQEAVQIVSEALEDEDRFPSERPGMDSYNARLGAWQKELATVPKTFVK